MLGFFAKKSLNKPNFFIIYPIDHDALHAVM